MGELKGGLFAFDIALFFKLFYELFIAYPLIE